MMWWPVAAHRTNRRCCLTMTFTRRSGSCVAHSMDLTVSCKWTAMRVTRSLSWRQLPVLAVDHARRKFIEASRAGTPSHKNSKRHTSKADVAIGYIQKLYAVKGKLLTWVVTKNTRRQTLAVLFWANLNRGLSVISRYWKIHWPTKPYSICLMSGMCLLPIATTATSIS